MFWKFIVFWIAFGVAMMLLALIVVAIFAVVTWLIDKKEDKMK